MSRSTSLLSRHPGLYWNYCGGISGSSVIDAFLDEAWLPAEEIASGLLELVGGIVEAIPLVTPVVVALRLVATAIKKVQDNKAQLDELMTRCKNITISVINKCRYSLVDVEPLVHFLSDLEKLAEDYRVRGKASKFFRNRSDDQRIQDLRGRLDHLIDVMELSTTVQISAQVEELRLLFISGQNMLLESVLKRFQEHRTNAENPQTEVSSPPAIKLAPVPRRAPITAHWHVVRNGVVDPVSRYLCMPDREGPSVVGIVGLSGSGKSTAAAAIVGDKHMGKILPHDGETHAEACDRLEQVRRYYPDGVVWLPVGRGAGSEDQLPKLMVQLARTVHDEVGNTGNYGPGEVPPKLEGCAAATEYIRDKISNGNGGDGYRCLLVADDVWELTVVEHLMTTGMRVLLTTRDINLVQGADRVAVRVDTLKPDEAEAALRGAAELRPDVPLPVSACGVIERCGSVAMYVGSVAKWESLKGRHDEVAWKKALNSIDKHVAELVAARAPGEAGDIIADRHHAILRAGFDSLASEGIHSKLYLALAVLPDSHSFAVHEAAVLLFGYRCVEPDVEQASEVVLMLERWAIVRVDGTGRYRMHDARRAFAKKTLMENEKARKTVVAHWREYLSALETLRSVDLLTLLGLWQGLENVGGDGWRKSFPYDKAVAEMDPADPTYFVSIKMLATLYQVEGDLDGAELLMLKVLKRNENLVDPNPLVIANALCWRVLTTSSRGQLLEARHLRTQMSELVDPAVAYWKGCRRTAGLEESLALHTLGSLCLTAGRIKEAEKWFQQALETHMAAKLAEYHAQVGATLQGLVHCLRHEGRFDEADVLIHRAVEIVKSRRGPNSLEEASTLCFLAVGELDAERPGEAEILFRRALDIYKQKNCPPPRLVPNLLHSLAVCLRGVERWREAEELLRESLAIQQKANGGSEREFHIACTLHAIALCARDAGRLDEAEKLFWHALGVLDDLGLQYDDPQVMATNTELARCLADMQSTKTSSG